MNPLKHILLLSDSLFIFKKTIRIAVYQRFFLNIAFLLFSLSTAQLKGQNNPPLIDTLYYCTGQMTPVVLCNDYIDPDGDETILTGGHTTFNCSLVFLNDSCVRYTPLPGFLGTDIVYLDVCDNSDPAACSVSVVYVHVGCLPPVANSDIAQINGNMFSFNGGETMPYSGTSLVLPVLENDDPLCTNNPVSIAVVLSPPLHGTYSFLPGNNSLNYTPDTGFSGTDMITYVTCNNCPLCDTATVTIVVEPPPPPCEPDIYLCLPVNGSSDFCPEFCNLNASDISLYEYSAINGNISAPDVNGCFTYSAQTGFSGEDLVAITACDNNGYCATTFAFVVISNLCDDAPPLPSDDFVLTNINVPASIFVLENDDSPNGLLLSVNEVTTPAHGNAVISNDGLVITYTPENGFTGSDTFTYSVCNTNGICASASVFVQVVQECMNEQQTCTQQGTPLEVCVSFCSLEGLTNVNLTSALSGNNMSISQLTGTCLIYTPLPTFTGTDLITITGCTEQGLCDTAFVYVEVGCFAPNASTDAVVSNANSPVSVNVAANDAEICQSFSGNISISVPPLNGTATVESNGNITYLPNIGFTGSDFLTYTICAACNSSACTNAQVFFTITESSMPENEDYMAQPDVVQTPFGTSITIDVLDNDPGNDLTILSYSLASNGIVIPNTDGTFTYIPIGSFTGSDYFFYQVCDNFGNCQQTIVAVTVLPAGNPPQNPIAHHDMVETNEGQSVTIPVLTNDSNPQGGSLNISNTTSPPNGVIAVNPDGTITFTPSPGFNGINTFTYTVCNSNDLCATATVSVAVGNASPSNKYPLSVNDFAAVSSGGTAIISLLANDTDPENQSLTASILSIPMHGTVGLDAETGEATYVSGAGFQGIDYFTYMACDDGFPALCDTAYVAISVGDGNVPPIAQDDIVYGMENTTLNIPVSLNDSDANHAPGDLIISSIPVLPQFGTVTIDGLQIIYQPNTGYTGNDEFSYLICDPAGDCDEATVTIIITDLVFAMPDVVSTNENVSVEINVLSNDLGSSIGISNIGNASNGTLTVEANGIIIYTPSIGFSGSDSFVYQICDNFGNCSQASVTVTVNQVVESNLPPIAQNDLSETAMGEPVTIDVLANDSDPEEEILTISSVSNPLSGTVLILGNSILYTPDIGFTGTDQFNYTITDSYGNSSSATVTIQVTVVPEETEACELKAASGFSPNADGTNDTYLISGIDAACFESIDIELIIFNRWGDKMFETSNYRNSEAWDGNWNNSGKEAPAGTYFYQIQYLNTQQKPVKLSGYLELVR